MQRKTRVCAKRNPCRALAVIDDASIRKESASAAFKVLKKLQRLEEKLANFTRTDQRLYEEWYQQSFSAILRDIEAKTRELREARELNFEIFEIARHRNIPLSGAYRWAIEEKRLFEAGDEEMRKEIRKIRRERQLFLWDEQDKEDAKAREEARRREEKRQKRWRDKYNKEEHENSNFEEVLENLERALAEFVKQEEKERSEQTGDEGDKDDEEEVEDEKEAEDLTQPLLAFSPEDEERLKILYRQLARLIHPDLSGRENNGKMEPWELELWAKAQQYLKYKCLWGMKDCLRLAQFRLNKLECLTVGELRVTKQKLENEFYFADRLSRRKRRLPAWNFSGKKLTARQLGKLTEELKFRYSSLEFHLGLIRAQHKKLEEESRSP